MSLAVGVGTVVGLSALVAAARLGRDAQPPGAGGRRRPSPDGRGTAQLRPPTGGGDRRTARWARSGDLDTLVVPRPLRRSATARVTAGRLVLGRRGRSLVASERSQSVIVFGPTQSHKTSGFAIPALLEWQGPVLASSVKTDLMEHTAEFRGTLGSVSCFDPSGSTGLPSATWSPLPASRTWPGARRAAAGLTEVAKHSAGTMSDGDFWYSTAAKMLAPLLFAASFGRLGMEDVVRWVDTQEEDEVLDLLEAAGVLQAVQSARSAFGKEERQRSSVYTTVETILEPFAAGGAGPTGGTGAGLRAAGGAVDPVALVGGANTLYLCAPAHDQRRLTPLFVSVVRQVVEHVFDQVARTGRPLDPPLLIVLDEAANIAPLADLDALASTAAGHGIQLVTIWHDLAQLNARYGPRAATVVNNHRAKLFLSGISDPATLDYASQLIGDEELLLAATTRGGTGGPSTTHSPSARRLAPPDALRRTPPGHGVLVYGGLPAARLRLRPWFDDARLSARGGARPRRD